MMNRSMKHHQARNQCQSKGWKVNPKQNRCFSSNIDSGRREQGANNLDTELEIEGNEPDEMDETEMADHKRFESLIQQKMDIPTSDNGLYLARTVAPVLTKALAEVLLVRFKQNFYFEKNLAPSRRPD